MISRYPLGDISELPEDLRLPIEEIAAKSGFVPNVFRALAHRPDELRAFMAYHNALMERPGGLTKTEREMIVVATSGANHCQYCVIAHGAILRIRSKNPLIADQVAINHHKAEVDPRHKAMLDFALKVANHSETVDDADFDRLRGHGFDDEDIWDIASITALFAMSNRIANFLSLRPNPEFYTMGR